MSNKTNKPRVGEKFTTNQGCECVVLEYNGAFNVVVQFLDNFKHIKRVCTGDLRNGEVSNPFFPSVFGVGYLGVDKNSPVGYKTGTREYMFWKGAMERSYSEVFHSKCASYIGCAVDSVWHNFQNFAEWCQWQIGFNEKGWQLDKDLLSPEGENKSYNPETCIFVPREINTLFIIPSTKTDDLPTGVSYCKDRGKYQAGCGAGGYRKALGRFSTPELAYQAYLGYKKIRVSELLDIYEHRIDPRLAVKLKEFMAQN